MVREEVKVINFRSLFESHKKVAIKLKTHEIFEIHAVVSNQVTR